MTIGKISYDIRIRMLLQKIFQCIVGVFTALTFFVIFWYFLYTILPPVKGFSVNEDYYHLWTVHSFNIETFEFSVPAELVLMTWLVLGKNWPHNHYYVTKTIVEWAFQILILMNFYDPLEIKCNFKKPSSSGLPLKHVMWTDLDVNPAR